MITVTYGDTSYECTMAIKGTDYVHLLDADGTMTAAFDGVVSFNGFTISGGSWTTPTAADECYVATIGDDGVIRKGGHRCSEIKNITYGTTDLTAGTSELATGSFYFVYE